MDMVNIPYKRKLISQIGNENRFNHSVYSGEFERGKKNGFGVLRLSDGSNYIGCFKDNSFNGYVKIKFNYREYILLRMAESSLVNGKTRIWMAMENFYGKMGIDILVFM